MSYQVLARKWRPRSFPEMVGQEHVLRALINALDNDRLHHAFLFTGTRGVGKTTVARILAKSINCEQGMSSRPCGECSSCREIDEGRFVDLIEVDAASRTKVEDTRELLDNVQYSPTRGRYKVYLIDEVHMLSNHSFNALLKTLEEPPPHVKFLLATTDPQKLPVTILSRCLQFNLKRLAPELIDGHLTRVLGSEKIAFEPAALHAIARAADGSMRDALSLLDQAIAYGAGKVSTDEVREMLGTIDRSRVFALLEALADHDARRLLGEAASLAEQAPDFGAALAELTSLLYRVALAQTLPEAVDDALGEGDAVRALAARIVPEEVQLYYQIALTGRRDLPLAPDGRTGFEMVLLRMLAFRPDDGGAARTEPGRPTAAPAPVPAPAAAPAPAGAMPSGRPSAAALRAAVTGQGPEAKPAPAVVVARPEPVVEAAATTPPPAREPAPKAAPAAAVQESPVVPPAERAPAPVAPPAGGDTEEWASLVGRLPLAGVTRQFALQCSLVRREGDLFELAIDPNQARHLRNEKREEALRQTLEEVIGRPVKLKVVMAGGGVTPAMVKQRQENERQQQAELAIADDPNIQLMTDRFGGRVVPGSVRPLEE
jgi:DNA polymerase-3 subunit gamma/tau